MDRDEIKEEVREALNQNGYFLDDYVAPAKNGLKKLIDKCTAYALENPTVDIVAHADTLVSECLYKIIWNCPDPKVSIHNWFNNWLPDNCVSASFYAGLGEWFTLADDDYPKWNKLPYAPYYTYSVPSNIQNQIKEQALKDLKDLYYEGYDDEDKENDSDRVEFEDDDLRERCIVLQYQTLR